MINPKDLRIGNYLRIKESGTVIQVEPYMLSVSELINYAPVVLSPEILEKCGFELRKEDETSIEIDYKLYPLYVKFEHNEGLLVTIHEYSSCSHVKYLHQLQNLYFALTGEELEFKP